MKKYLQIRITGILLLSFISLFWISACSETDISQPSITPTSQLNQWFNNGLAGKKICFVGDSTTSNATALFSELNNFYIKEGESLNGVSSILNYGENGASLRAFLSDRVIYGITAAIAAQADLYILNYGINDVRLGETSTDQLIGLLRQAIDRIREEVPKADIVLSMPNSFLSTNTHDLDFVQPNGNAQFYTDLLRAAYLRLENQWGNVVLLDTHKLVYGSESLPDTLYMANQIHPSSAGYKLLAKTLVDLIGSSQAYNSALADYAIQENPSAPYDIYPRVVENPVYYSLVASGRWVSSSVTGDENGYIDFDWPDDRFSEIVCGDLLQMAENHVFQLPPSCFITPLLENTRIYNLGSSLPPITMTGGTINVWRAR